MNLLLPGIAAAYLLTFARIGTLMMLLPGLGEQSVSPRIRLAFALLVSLILFPMVRPLLPMEGGAIAGPGLVSLLIGEFMVGLVLGLTVRMVLAALQTAGVIVSQQLDWSSMRRPRRTRPLRDARESGSSHVVLFADATA